MNQLVIALTGVIAISLLQWGRGPWHRAGSWVGLAGQPFWLWETWQARQHGMFTLSAIYTAIYIAGVLHARSR